MRHSVLVTTTAAATTVVALAAGSIQGGSKGARPASGPAGAITMDALVAIKHPSRATWSPDGKRVAFVWDAGGVQNLYVVNADGGAPTALTKFDDESIETLFWEKDGGTIAFGRDGRLWRVKAGGGEPEMLWKNDGTIAGAALSHDGTRIAFDRGGDLWIKTLADGVEKRLTSTPANEGGPVWSPDDQKIAFTTATAERKEEAPDYVGAKILFTRFERSTSDVGVVSVSGGKPVIVGATDGSESAPAWSDAAHLVLQRISPDFRTREVLAGDAATGSARTLSHEADEKWWSVAGDSRPLLTPSPDGKSVAFISDRDGYDHLYVVPVAGGDAVQVTRGKYEVRNIAWSPDSTRIAFDTNDGDNPDTRQLAVATLGGDPAHARIEVRTSGRGTNIEPAWSPDGRRLLYQHTDPRNSADLYIVDDRSGSDRAAHRLTDSLPPGIDRAQLVPPQLVHFPAPDGAQVPASLFVPTGLDRSQKHPAIVWVHGDGTNQNYDGWHVQRNYAVYYSFHQYLAQRGYVVLAVDYRGSIGYGRTWRQGHYRDLGGKDYQDVAAAMKYLGTLGYVDTSRVGLWGLSYGGFMTLQGVTVTPDLFRCAIDVAGVDDWADWYKDPDGPWIKSRMGSPEENAEIYRRSAPIYRVDKITRPLLVLAGTADVNVPFLESVRLLDALLKAGKNVDFMMYPGEFHYFTRAHVLRDAWTRAERFFDAHLKTGPERATDARQ